MWNKLEQGNEVNRKGIKTNFKEMEKRKSK